MGTGGRPTGRWAGWTVTAVVACLVAAAPTVSRPIPAVAAETASWVDAAFGGGIVSLDLSPGKDVARDLAVQDDGRVVVAATADWQSDRSDIVVLRFLPDGRPDTGFGAGGRVVVDRGGPEAAIGVAVQPDGRIVVAGQSAEYGRPQQLLVTRLDGAGRHDPTFAGGLATIELSRPGFDGAGVGAMALAPDGRIVVGGGVRNGNVTGAAALRLNVDGSLDATFGEGGLAYRRPAVSPDLYWNEAVSSVVVRPDGAVVVGGTARRPTSGGRT